MDSQEQLTPQQYIADRLNDAIRKAEAGHVDDALVAVKEAKAADTKNIYLIAFEKQIAKLSDGSLSPEGKSEILKSLPSMTDRALADSNRRLTAKPADVQAQQAAREKEAALEKLKSQYFRRADDYIAKGDYVHAMEEVKRIYIIDPNNIVAKEYELKVEQMGAIKPTSTAGEADSTTEQSSEQAPTHDAYVMEEDEPTSKIPIIIGIGVVIIAVVGWFLFSKKTTDEKPVAATQMTEDAIPNLPTEAVVTPEGTEMRKVEAPPPEEKQISTPPVDAQKTAPAKQTQKTQPEQRPAPQQTAPVKETVVPKPQQAPPTVQQQAPQQQTAPVQQQTPPPQTQPAPTQTAQPAPVQREAVPRPFIAIESNPELLQMARARYPEIAMRTRVEGRVVVEVTIDSQGKPVQARILKSSSTLFDDAAIDAAMRSTYKPAVMANGPVTGKMAIPINFQLPR